MKKLIITLLLIATYLGLPAQAQEKDFTKRFDEVKQRLNLSPEQVELISPILLDSAQRIKIVLAKYDTDISKDADRKSDKLGFSQLRKLAKEMSNEREITSVALAKHLTPIQMEEFDKIQAERKQEMRDRLLKR